MQKLEVQIILNTVSKVCPLRRTGRPRLDAENILNAIDLVLRSGMAWRHLKHTHFTDTCHYTTIHKTFTKWVDLGVFEATYKTILRLDASRRRRGPRYYCIDSTQVKNQYGRDCVGPNPTDRGRKGTKLSVLVDDRGVPIALACFGANISDFRTVEDTFDKKKLPLRPRRTLYADKGYDSARIRSFVSSMGLKPCIARRGSVTPRYQVSPPGVVENLFAWLDKYRRLLVRYEVKIAAYLQFTYLACCHILGRRQN